MRKLLIVTYYFPPSAASGSFRLLGFARHLPSFGWRTAVVAPPEMPLEPSDEGLRGRVPPETVYYHAPFPRGLTYRLGQRVAGRSCWLPRAVLAARRAVREQRPDAVLTSGPPHLVHLIGLALKRSYGLPWVADFRDPWVTGSVTAGDSPRDDRWAGRLERAVLRSADAIVSNAPLAGEMVAEAYPEFAGKLSVLTNGFDPEDFPATPPPAGPGGPVRVVHAGELYARREPRPFLDALRDVNRAGGRRFELRLLGRTDGLDFDLHAEIAVRDLSCATALVGQVPYDLCHEEMARADILLLMDTPGRRVGVPAKLYEYLGSRRPILALAEEDGDLARVLRQSGVPHRIARPFDVASIAQALVELANTRPLTQFEPDLANGLLRFTRADIARRQADILDGLCRRRGDGAS